MCSPRSTSKTPYVTYRSGDDIVRIDCDYVIGADGFHGVSHKVDPEGCAA